MDIFVIYNTVREQAHWIMAINEHKKNKIKSKLAFTNKLESPQYDARCTPNENIHRACINIEICLKIQYL